MFLAFDFSDSYKEDASSGERYMTHPMFVRVRTGELTAWGEGAELRMFTGSTNTNALNKMTSLPPPLPPDVLLRIDTNQDWENFHKAGEVPRELAWNQRLEYVEQPVTRDQPEDMRRLSDHFGIPVFVDESVIGPMEAMHLVEANLVDGLCIKLAKCGSFSDGILIANIAALRHLPVTPVSASGTSLSAAAELQMLCIMPFLSSTVELCHYMLPEDIGWPKLGYAPIVSVPETVGMGAEMESDVFA
jgi:L-alanine-DL-glutamate epimerase-like enolase superfamily enzyme